MTIHIKEIVNDYNLTLNKINGNLLGKINNKYLKEINKSIMDIDKISLSIPKYILSEENFKRVINPIYGDFKHERLIYLNNKETYIVKNIDITDQYKNITAESREVRLKKIDLKFEDIGFRLTSKDEENDIYCLGDYMYEETGWKFGHIDNKVKFQDDGVTEKMRWQESVEGYWYEYLTQTIAEQFECVVIFDSYNKLVNLYDIDGFGGEVKLYLTNDNYIKSLEKQTSSADVVTRLRLEGNSGLTIIEGNPSGVDYIENYSYFIENEEMSTELIQALSTYDMMVKKRAVDWNNLINYKNERQKVFNDKKIERFQLISDIKATESMKNAESSRKDPNAELLARYIAELTKYRDKEVLLDREIKEIEDGIERTQSTINEITILCQKPTATDDNGQLIFNEGLLNELKDYIYVDTFSDDAYLKIEDLLSVGKRKLELTCKPTSTWNVDVVDFTDRIIDNNFHQHFKGTLNLGDIIILYDEDNDKEEFVYFTSFSKRPNEKELDITLSNKKVERDDIVGMSAVLTESKKMARLLKSKRYLLMNQEKNRINLEYHRGGI